MKKIIIVASAVAAVLACVSCGGEKKPEQLKKLFRGEFDSFVTDNGKAVDIFSVKHGTVAMRIDGKWLYVDPAVEGDPVVKYSRMPKADYILFTHDHSDHFDRTALNDLSKDNTKVFGNQAVIDILGYGHRMRNGEKTMTEDKVKIEAVPAYNISEEKLQFHPQGRDNGYIINYDGFRIYVAGDLEDIPELALVEDIDVAFLPCNLPYTMTPEQCAEAAKTVMPKVLFPYHYGETDIQQVVTLLQDSGIDVRIRLYQ